MILFGVLLGVGGGGLGSFYPQNVETALDTLINTKTGMKSINIQPDIENINTTLPDNFTACATSCPAAECRKKNARTTARLTPKIISQMSQKFLKRWPLAINEIIHVIRRSRICVLLDSAMKRND